MSLFAKLCSSSSEIENERFTQQSYNPSKKESQSTIEPNSLSKTIPTRINLQKLKTETQAMKLSGRQNSGAKFSFRDETALMRQQMERLQVQNKKLRGIIENEYRPLKKSYTKLMEDQQRKQKIIKELQWRVQQISHLYSRK